MAAGSSFTDAMRSALIGVGAIITGKRDAVTHFDVSRPGLVDSFIALLISTGIVGLLQILMSGSVNSGAVFEFTVSIAVLLALQVGGTGIFLRVLGRHDRLLHYVLVDNWANFFLLLGSLSLTIMGAPFGLVLIAAVIAGVLLMINTGRIVLGLKPMQVAMFFVIQVMANLAGYAVLFSLFPSDPSAVNSLPL